MTAKQHLEAQIEQHKVGRFGECRSDLFIGVGQYYWPSIDAIHAIVRNLNQAAQNDYHCEVSRRLDYPDFNQCAEALSTALDMEFRRRNQS